MTHEAPPSLVGKSSHRARTSLCTTCHPLPSIPQVCMFLPLPFTGDGCKATYNLVDTSPVFQACARSLDVETCLLYNAGSITSTRDRPGSNFLPLTAQKEVQHGRPRRTATRQLSAGRPVRAGRLCRGVSGAAPATHVAGGDQGATHPPRGQRGGALLPGSRDDCEADASLHCARL